MPEQEEGPREDVGAALGAERDWPVTNGGCGLAVPYGGRGLRLE
jgi:hypothetical protein